MMGDIYELVYEGCGWGEEVKRVVEGMREVNLMEERREGLWV